MTKIKHFASDQHLPDLGRMPVVLSVLLFKINRKGKSILKSVSNTKALKIELIRA